MAFSQRNSQEVCVDATLIIQIAGGALLAGLVLLLVWLAYQGLRLIVRKMVEGNTVW
jgi:hypothetical protein